MGHKSIRGFLAAIGAVTLSSIGCGVVLPTPNPPDRCCCMRPGTLEGTETDRTSCFSPDNCVAPWSKTEKGTCVHSTQADVRLTADLAPADTVKGTPVAPISANCEDDCNANRPICMEFSVSRLANAAAVRKAVSLFERALKAPGPTTIKTAELMTLFSLANDPCQRSDFTINANAIANSGPGGSSCTLTDKGTSLVLPATLTGRTAVNKDGSIEITFPNASEAPMLSSKNVLLSNWNGTLRRIRMNAKSIVLTVDAKCILVDLG